MHAEHGAVVRLMTPDDGLQAAYVRGARGRRMRPVLVPGNLVQARLRSRTEEQLAHAEIELIHSRAPLLSEPLAGRGDRLGDGADRRNIAGRSALSAICTMGWTPCSG